MDGMLNLNLVLNDAVSAGTTIDAAETSVNDANPLFGDAMQEALLDETHPLVELPSLMDDQNLLINDLDNNKILIENEQPEIDIRELISDDLPLMDDILDDDAALQDALTLAWFGMEGFNPPATSKNDDISDKSDVADALAVKKDIQLAVMENKNISEDAHPKDFLNSGDNTFIVDELKQNNFDSAKWDNDESFFDLTFNTQLDDDVSKKIIQHFSLNDSSEHKEFTPNIAFNTTSATPTNSSLKSTQEVSMPLELTVAESIDDSAWSDSFAERVIWMGQKQIDNARIHIHPKELGPIDIQIKMQDDKVTVNIQAHHLPVRDLIEQSVQKLREMFQEQGVQLADVQVNTQSGREENASKYTPSDEGRPAFEDASGLPLDKEVNQKINEGLVDYFA